MASPLGLTIKNSLNDMQIGDCIPCRYTATSGAAGSFSELGTCTAAEIPLAGTATPDGLFYFIKVDKGTLIADRILQHSISWITLNTAKFIEGKPVILNSINTKIRSMSGGVAYLNTDGTSSTTNKSLGAWPPNNEWDKYIVNSNLKGKITAGDDNIWHWNNGMGSLVKDTPITAINTNDYRVSRGKRVISGTAYGVDAKFVSPSTPSASAYTGIGFRPLLNYVESDIASEVIY